MTRLQKSMWLPLAVAATALCAQESPQEPVTFRSDVSLVRVDVQVLDRSQRFVPRLTAEDFVLREDGRVVPIKNFGREELPLDVLFLIDVSRSMRPHVEAVAQASSDALNVLGNDDRVAIMTFDRSPRVHSGFKNRRDGANREFSRMLDQEDFNGGTDITKALMAAVDYVRKEARTDARRAIVIVTDDQTERERNEEGVIASLNKADTVLSVLLAPNSMGNLTRRQPRSRSGGSWPTINLPWPGGGGGPVQFPGPGGGGGGFGTQSAGTREIAERSGGDSFPVDDASSLERTLARLRQRYALYFQLPAGAQAGEERQIDVQLSSAASRKNPGAEVKYRKSYLATTNGAVTDSATVTGAPAARPGGWRRAEPGEK